MPYKDPAKQREAVRDSPGGGIASASERPPAAAKAAAKPKPPPVPPRPVSDPAGELVKWAGRALKVPTGPLAGKPFKVAGWQADWLRAALAPGVREAALSVARKNGKSGVIAALLLAYLAGPLRRPLWRGVVVSLSGKLAVELRDAIEQTAEASGIAVDVKRSPYPGRIEGPDGTRLDILAADRRIGPCHRRGPGSDRRGGPAARESARALGCGLLQRLGPRRPPAVRSAITGGRADVRGAVRAAGR